jgi:hypothetical protein
MFYWQSFLNKLDMMLVILGCPQRWKTSLTKETWWKWTMRMRDIRLVKSF